MEGKHILWFKEIGIEDVGIVGGKNASLGEMYQHLTAQNVRIPNGFAVTANSYFYLLKSNDAMEKLRAILEGIDVNNVDDLSRRGRRARNLIRGLRFPDDLDAAIKDAYRALSHEYGGDAHHGTDVAVRSSATAEDLPDASFAGQQETFLNVFGNDEVLEACSKCFASLFTDRAIAYRVARGFDHFKVGLSVVVQKMVRSDLASSGVMFTLDTESGFPDAVFVTGAYGLGENVVQGAVNPDEFYVFKPTLCTHAPLISKHVGSKALRMVYAGGGKQVKNTPVSVEEQRVFCLSDADVLTLARWAVAVEDHYSRKAGHAKPMDLEWAKDGRSGELFIVQARPETVQSRRDADVLVNYAFDAPRDAALAEVLCRGQSVGEKIAAGKVCVVRSVKNVERFVPGTVLVTEMTDPDWSPIMRQAAAIITNSGGRTCHAAIVSRELGIPCVVGTGNATDLLRDGDAVTVDCASGSEGRVLRGELRFTAAETKIGALPATRTKVSLVVGNPGFEHARLPHQGVGLARMEFIVTNYVRAHPLALCDFPELPGDDAERAAACAAIEELTAAYGADKKRYFVEKLSHGVGTIAAAFYPKRVILRMSDFKTNEYASLLGGAPYEPVESNPMLGFRGASRYYSKEYERGFALECSAVKRVREEFGLTNLAVMIPFCRTVDECRKVVETMEKYGLRRGKKGEDGALQVFLMCEIPANVLLADQFLEFCDGFSIGSNDLTQLTLGLDRDAGQLSHIGNELNPAVLKLIDMAIAACRARNKYVGICGQAPSDYPEMCKFLVERGIDSISVSPDRFLKTILLVKEFEDQQKK